MAKLPGFYKAFLERYVQGREAPDYGALLAAAGLRARRLSPGRATLGPVPLERRGSRLRVAGPVAPAAALSEAGLAEDDEIVGVEGREPATPAEARAMTELSRIRAEVVVCRACPRLVDHRERVAREKVARFADQGRNGAIPKGSSGDSPRCWPPFWPGPCSVKP